MIGFEDCADRSRLLIGWLDFEVVIATQRELKVMDEEVLLRSLEPYCMFTGSSSLKFGLFAV